jgi:hypothetical protein
LADIAANDCHGRHREHFHKTEFVAGSWGCESTVSFADVHRRAVSAQAISMTAKEFGSCPGGVMPP